MTLLTFWLSLSTAAAQTELCWEPTLRAAKRSTRRGERASAKGDSAAAIAHFEAALEAQPGCGAVQQQLGEQLLSVGRLEEARAALTPAMARFPEEAGVLVLLSAIARQQGQQDSARLLARQALALAPDSLDALHNVFEVLRAERSWLAIDALLAQQEGMHTPADIACMRSVSALDLGDVTIAESARALCQADGAPSLVTWADETWSAAVVGEQNLDEETLQAINVAMEAGEWQEALDRIDALPLPLELSVRIVRGTCLFKLERLEEAIIELDRALAGGERLVVIDPEKSSFYEAQLKSAARLKVRALALMGQEAQAQEALAAARDSLGQDYGFHQIEIILLRQSGQIEAAIAVWRDAVRRWPDEPDLHGALYDLIQANARAITPDMWGFLSRSVDPQHLFVLATHHLEEDDPSGCLNYAERALTLGAVSEEVRNLSYHCAVRSGDFELAEIRRKQLGLAVMPMLLLQHALLAEQAGQLDTARELLVAACPRLIGEEMWRCQAALESLD